MARRSRAASANRGSRRTDASTMGSPFERSTGEWHLSVTPPVPLGKVSRGFQLPIIDTNKATTQACRSSLVIRNAELDGVQAVRKSCRIKIRPGNRPATEHDVRIVWEEGGDVVVASPERCWTPYRSAAKVIRET